MDVDFSAWGSIFVAVCVGFYAWGSIFVAAGMGFHATGSISAARLGASLQRDWDLCSRTESIFEAELGASLQRYWERLCSGTGGVSAASLGACLSGTKSTLVHYEIPSEFLDHSLVPLLC